MESHRHLAVVSPTLEVAVGQDVDLQVDADLAEVVLDQHCCLLVLSLRLLDPQFDRERLHAGLLEYFLGLVQVEGVHPGGFALIGLHRRRHQGSSLLRIAVLDIFEKRVIGHGPRDGLTDQLVVQRRVRPVHIQVVDP